MSSDLTAEAEARLRELAKRATPGPWFADKTDDMNEDWYTQFTSVKPVDGPQVTLLAEGGGSRRNAEFVAAANPATVLTLIAALQAERERADHFTALARDAREALVKYVTLTDDAGIAALAADPALTEWCERNPKENA